MDKKLVQEVIDNLYFSKEAADYLGITVQRLNQIVQLGKLKPVKKTPSGMLFLKQDLDERIQELEQGAIDINKNKTHKKIDIETPFLKEVINYYTIQAFFNYSDKKTEPVFREMSLKINFQESMDKIIEDVSCWLQIEKSVILKTYKNVIKGFEKLNEDDVIIKKGMKEYPKLLEMTEEAPPYLFLRGNISLLREKIVSVVGSRKASEEGKQKAYRLSQYLGKVGIVVASGLAYGIDTAAHTASIKNNYSTIAVIGTPITKVYPKENEWLQNEISQKGLVVSQFAPSAPVQRWYFPMRNAIMSGISLATVIIEAGETSGALKQADYALKQNRMVFIPQSAIDNDKITWPKKYIQRKGAYKFSKIEELLKILEKTEIIPSNLEQVSLFSEGADGIYVHRLK